MPDFVQSLAIESWTLYSVGLLLIACRIASRCISLGGWRKLQVEDMLMLVAGATFTADMWSINETAKNGSNYMSDEQAASLTPEEVDMAIYGSKMTLALEMFTLATTWLVKACLLFLYHRLTLGYDKQHLAVKIIAVYCVIAYALVVVLCLTYWCHPIYEYWRVPVKYPQCATYYNHMIFATAFNISSDLMLICIPIPIIVRSHLPLKRKIVLCCVLGLGVLNILAAILNRYYNFSNPNDLGYIYWYVGEVATAVYVGNVPLCWPLIRRMFRSVGSFAADSANDGANDAHRPNPGDPAPHIFDGSRRAKKRGPLSTLPSSLWATTVASTAWDGDERGDTGSDSRKAGKETMLTGSRAVDREETGSRERICNPAEDNKNKGNSLELEEGWSRKGTSSSRGSGKRDINSGDLEAGFGTAHKTV